MEHAQPCDEMRGQSVDSPPIEKNVPACRFKDTADAVEKRCLAGAVGSDNRLDEASISLITDAVKGGQTSEMHLYAIERQIGVGTSAAVVFTGLHP